MQTSLHLSSTSPNSAHPHMLAPPVSIASISACVHGVLPNLGGSSLLSKYMPFGGSTLPNERPECPPIAPYASDEVGTDG